MANVQDTKAALANKANGTVAKKDVSQLTPKQQVRHYLESMQGDISKALPAHMTPERMTNIALTVIRSNPELLECTVPSLLGAVVQAAQLGLEPGLIGHCYFVPFNNKKKIDGKDVWQKDVQFLIGYKGMIDLARRSGHMKNIYAYTVHENDAFEYELGLEPKLHHKPAIGDRGALIYVYGVAHFKDGGYHMEIMSKTEIERIKGSSKAGTYGPWKDHYEEMAKKTVIRRMFKYLPISIEIQDNVSKDETVRKDITSEPEPIEYTDAEFTEEGSDQETTPPESDPFDGQQFPFDV